MKQIYDRNYPMTKIIVICSQSLVFAFVFLFCSFQYGSTEALYRFEGSTAAEDTYRVLASFAAIFVHIGLEHFVVNMLTLYFLGPSR